MLRGIAAAEKVFMYDEIEGVNKIKKMGNTHFTKRL